ncbi:hypothetical protein MIR68_000285 [Amoeboaphelidium protococcarum]|nr:hypothetical protein MIR68_000285 [Amoeboaphelidium protococcarum]
MIVLQVIACSVLLLQHIDAFLSGNGTVNKNNPLPLQTHYSIDSEGFGSSQVAVFQDQTVQKLIYRGNYFRDLSQIPPKFMQKHFKKLLMRIVNHFVNTQLQLEREHVTPITFEQFGTYRFMEHVDNPVYLDKSGKPRFDKMKCVQYAQINPETNTINYLATSNHLWRTGADVILSNLYNATLILQDARKTGSSDLKRDLLVQAYMLFGNALHTVQDFFAHSNFVELAIHMQMIMSEHGVQGLQDQKIMKQYFQSFFVFVGEDTLERCGGNLHQYLCYPLVTGLHNYGKADTLFNINSLLAGGVSKGFRKQHSWWQAFKRKVYLQFSKNSIEHQTEKSNIFMDPMSLYPTHTELNKDHNNNPLHLLAARCAIDVTRQFAHSMAPFFDLDKQLNDKKVAFDQVVSLTYNFMAHPLHVHFSEHDSQHYHPLAECMKIISEWIDDEGNTFRLSLLKYEFAKSGRNKLMPQDYLAHNVDGNESSSEVDAEDLEDRFDDESGLPLIA